jgi:23S rRNA (pseudouridine1915-N3)-methyltransferase
LLDCVRAGAVAVALDERGQQLSSDEFAALIARERDGGVPEMVFLIGGADGHDRSLRAAAGHRLSFGPMVWPHMLARVMLAEQIYRAVSILAGSPYHRA